MSNGIGPIEPPPRTLLSLSRYAEIMGIPLTHFWQMNGPKAPLVGGCDDVWDIQDRIDLAYTILQAEEMIAEELMYWPAPKYITNEEIQFQSNWEYNNWRRVKNDWQNAPVKTKWKIVSCLGTELLTLKKADASVFYSNKDNDPLGREETAQIGLGLYSDLEACSNKCEVAVFFRVEDGAEDTADPRWEIRPLKIDIDGSTMNITGESSLFLKPSLQALTKQDCEGSDEPNAWKYNFDVDNLVTHVDVYCRTTLNKLPVTLYWDGICQCDGACQHKTKTACGLLQNKRAGAFIPRGATWNGTTNVYSPTPYFTYPYDVPPMKMTVNYKAGYPLDSNCRMDSRLERAIIKLANSLMPNPPCEYCDLALRRWTYDREKVDNLTVENAQLPWHLYTKGALEAWRIVKRMAYGRGG